MRWIWNLPQHLNPSAAWVSDLTWPGLVIPDRIGLLVGCDCIPGFGNMIFFFGLRFISLLHTSIIYFLFLYSLLPLPDVLLIPYSLTPSLSHYYFVSHFCCQWFIPPAFFFRFSTPVSSHTCSPTGVVDKSVELLSSKEESLTLDAVFEVAEKAMVGDSENTQINDDTYCRENHRKYRCCRRLISPLLLFLLLLLLLLLLFPPSAHEPEPRPPRPPFPVPFDPVPFAAEDPETRLAKRSIWGGYGSYYTEQVDAIKMFEVRGGCVDGRSGWLCEC